MDKKIIHSECPACSYKFATPFFKDKQPLSMIAWAKSEIEAKSLEALDLDFHRCLECGHIYNNSFSYDKVPYQEKPNLMFNKGATWSVFIENARTSIVNKLPDRPTVVEIGYGDGNFIYSLARDLHFKGNFIGFDPSGIKAQNDKLIFKNSFFEPKLHIPTLKPDLIIMRHVLEHLINPLEFLQQIKLMSSLIDYPINSYIEVPCVDNLLRTNRTSDLYYEHYSQFTTQSFKSMLEKVGCEIVECEHGYNGEVIYAQIEFTPEEKYQQNLLLRIILK